MQALRLLKRDGFVQDAPLAGNAGRSRGLQVTPLDPAWIAQVYEVRGRRVRHKWLLLKLIECISGVGRPIAISARSQRCYPGWELLQGDKGSYLAQDPEWQPELAAAAVDHQHNLLVAFILIIARN